MKKIKINNNLKFVSDEKTYFFNGSGGNGCTCLCRVRRLG